MHQSTMPFPKQLLLPLTVYSFKSVHLEQCQGLHSLNKRVKHQDLDSIYNWQKNSLRGPFLQPQGLLASKQHWAEAGMESLPTPLTPDPFPFGPLPWHSPVRCWAPGSNLGNWLKAITMKQKEETVWWEMIRRETRTAGGNMRGTERRENGMGKGQRMNRKEVSKNRIWMRTAKGKKTEIYSSPFNSDFFFLPQPVSHADLSCPLCIFKSTDALYLNLC